MAAVATPRVVAFSPAEHSRHIGSRSPMRLSFSTPMDPASVERRLSLEPSQPGRLEWEDNTLVFHPLQPWPTDQPVQVRLAAFARSAGGLPTLRGFSWGFQVDPPRVLYLWPASGTAQLYALDPEGGTREFLAGAEHGVVDYAVGPQGDRLIYAALRGDGGVDLRLLDLGSGEDTLVYACPEGIRCQSLDLGMDGEQLAFERSSWLNGAGGRRVPGPKQVWEIDLLDSEPVPLGPSEHDTFYPRWSPSGLLAFYDASLGSVTVLDPQQRTSPLTVSTIPNQLGLPGSWSVDGATLILADMLFTEASNAEQSGGERPVVFYSHLFAFDVLSGGAADLSAPERAPVEDASPTVSPDGRWIAFARKYLDHRWTPGRQLWVMRLDGSQSRQLTFDADFNHAGLSWSPDSSRLVYVRVNQTSPTAPPTIWMLALNQDQPLALVENALQPTWIP